MVDRSTTGVIMGGKGSEDWGNCHSSPWVIATAFMPSANPALSWGQIYWEAGVGSPAGMSSVDVCMVLVHVYRLALAI